MTFLGYSFRGRFLVLSQKSLKRFKYRLRQLTGRSWSVSWQHRYQKLRQYLIGWMNYFSLSTYDPILQLDHWIRRRIRACYLKQWRKPRTKIRHLIQLGVPVTLAICIGVSSKGYYRLAKTKAMQMGLTNQWLKTQGFVFLKDQ